MAVSVPALTVARLGTANNEILTRLVAARHLTLR